MKALLDGFQKINLVNCGIDDPAARVRESSYKSLTSGKGKLGEKHSVVERICCLERKMRKRELKKKNSFF